MNRTKTIKLRLIFAVFVLLAPLVFTSCIDYVQTVSYKDGAYRLYYKITLSKLLFALGDEDPEDVLEGFDGEAFSELPNAVEARSVNTDLEVGAEFAFSVSPKTADKAEKSFLPTVAGNKCYIPFLLGSETKSFANLFETDSEYESIAEAVLSSAKCRVMVSKSVIARVATAYFEGRGGQNCPVAVFDYGESWCMEIPFIALFDDSMYRFDRLVVIKE